MQTKDLEDQKRPGQDLEIIKWNNTTLVHIFMKTTKIIAVKMSPKRAVHLKYHVYYLSWLYSFYTEENRVNYSIMNNKIQIL